MACEPDPDMKTNPTLHGEAVIKSSFLNIWTSAYTVTAMTSGPVCAQAPQNHRALAPPCGNYVYYSCASAMTTDRSTFTHFTIKQEHTDTRVASCMLL